MARSFKGKSVGGNGAHMRVVQDDITPRLAAFPAVVDKMMHAATEFHAPRAQRYMRDNAPWTDRTSNARNGLFATAQHEFLRHRIICYHTLPYGIFLEIRWNGKYRIIVPTILAEGPQVMRTLNLALAKIA